MQEHQMIRNPSKKQKEQQRSEDVAVTQETNTTFSLKGETIKAGDLEVRKDSLNTVLLILLWLYVVMNE